MEPPSHPPDMDGLPTPAGEDGWDVAPRLRQRIMTETPSTRPPVMPEPSLARRGAVLSPEEIEMLLRPDLSDMDEAEAAAETAPSAPEARPVPELRPQQEAEVSPGRQEAARRIAARLSRGVREHCGLQAAFTVRHVAPVILAEAVMGRAERGQAIVCFAGAQGDVPALLAIGAGLAQLMVETACGGPPPVSQPRQLSPIDLALLEGLTRPVAGAIAEGISFSGVETDPLFAASVTAPGQGYEIVFAVRAGGADWPARLLIAQDLLEELSIPAAEAKAAPAPVAAPGGLTVLLTARVASVDLPLSRLTRLRPGATLLLGVPADQPVELVNGGADGEIVAEAEIGRKGNRMAVRVTKRGPALRSYDQNRAG